MSNDYEYAEMLEIPVQTCTVSSKPATVKPKRRSKKTVNSDIKEKVIETVNERVDEKNFKPVEEEVTEKAEEKETVQESAVDTNATSEKKEDVTENKEDVSNAVEKKEEKNFEVCESRETTKDSEVNIVETVKKKKRISIVGIEAIAVVALVLVIVITNLVMENSGINTLVKIMNGTYVSKVIENDDEYSVFTANTPADASSVTLSEGIMTVNKEGSIYSPCDGKVTGLIKNDGKYVMEITHNKNFKTVISGIDYCYYGINDRIYSTVPVGYLQKETLSVSLYDKEQLITEYTLDNGRIVWSV